ncbi:MAG TPA: peptidoglycan-binding domain-containing protein [Paenirhodobacter sp.]
MPLPKTRPPVLCLAVAALLAACVQAPSAQGPGRQSLAAELHRGTAPETPEHCIGALQDNGSYRWFSAVCPEFFTQDMNFMLQRALAARGDYTGIPDGRFDAKTQAAILAYQSARGLPSPTLAARAAQQMGLIPWLD